MCMQLAARVGRDELIEFFKGAGKVSSSSCSYIIRLYLCCEVLRYNVGSPFLKSFLLLIKLQYVHSLIFFFSTIHTILCNSFCL